MFGRKVNFTVNGEEKYKTMYGATVSTFITFAMLAFTTFRFIGFVTRHDPMISMTSSRRKPSEDPAFKPQDSGFEFGFGLSKPLSPSIGYFTVDYVHYKKDVR